jgi:hypothetical protein
MIMEMMEWEKEELFKWALWGDINRLSKYVSDGGDLNVRCSKSSNHSLIESALKGREYETAIWLFEHGCKLTEDEQKEIDWEYKKIKCIEKLTSCKKL